jgi:Predicted membrane protein
MIKTIKGLTEYVGSLSGEALRYVVAGALTTLVNFSLFAFMTERLKIAYTVSNVASISTAILFAYIINKRFVFKNRCTTKIALALEFIKFVGARLFTMALEVGAVVLFVETLGQKELVGKAASQILVVITNFLISKMIVFRKKRDRKI